MILHLFRCNSNKLLTAITIEKDGNNLPKDICKGQWEYWKYLDIKIGDPPRIAAPSSEEILEAIEKNGFMINQAEIKFTEHIEKK